MSYQIRMSKVEGGEALRTDIVEGLCLKLPEVGASFTVYANPLADDCHFRYVKTSTVVSVDAGVDADTGFDTYVFRTQNSTYRVQVEFEHLEGESRPRHYHES